MADPHASLAHFTALPLIAILRGVAPDDVVAIGTAVCAAGFRVVEIPLNSPHPLDSIRRLAAAIGDRAAVGAGTVPLISVRRSTTAPPACRDSRGIERIRPRV